MYYETDKNDHGLRHNPLKACVVPRPIGWISTMSVAGVVNLAPFSFFNVLCYDPPFVLFSMLTGVALLFVGDPTSTQVIFTIIGIAGSAGIAATSIGVNMRINRTMAKWNADDPPPEFQPLITRWIAVHRARTLSGTLAFVCYLVAALA